MLVGEAESVDLASSCLHCLNECNATTGDDAFFNGCLCITNCVFDPVLAFLEFNFSGCANLDHCNAARKFRQTLLQLLAVVVAVALVDLSANLVDATLNLVGVPATFNNGGLVLGDNNFAGMTKKI